MAHALSDHGRVGTHTSGWTYFAGYLMIVAGFFQIIAGLAALFKPTVYLTTQNQLIFLDFTQWGWTHLLIGAILAISAAALFAGKTWGRVVAITLAIISALANFAFIWAYPLWSTLIIVMDVFIIYNVAVHGSRHTT